MTFATEPLDKRHKRANFSCGSVALDRYLRERAGQDAKKRVAATFAYIDPDSARIIGYYTLSSFSVELTAIPDSIAKKLPRYPRIPATLIGRLAVDSDFKGKGFGALLLVDALRRSLEGAKQVASFAVVVDAKDQAAKAFYGHFGFRSFKDAVNRLFLPMGAVEQLFKD